MKRAPASSSSSQSTSTTAPATTTTTNKLEDSNQKKQQTTTSSTTPSSASTSTSTSTSSPASSAALIPTAPTTPTTHFTHSLLHLINPQLPHEKRTRILVVNDVRGRLALLNELAKAENADYVISTGNFGFFDDTSYQTIREDELRDRMVKISRIPADKHHIGNLSAPELRNYGKTNHILSDLPLFLRKEKTLTVPVYTVWGRHEDVHVVEKFRNNELSLANLFILDERHTYKVESLRLFGLGGSITHNKFFDTGSGRSTIAGENGKMWTTLLQIGELLKLAHQTRDEPLKPQIQKVLFSKTESTHSSIDPVPITRLFVSHVGAGIEPLVAQIAYELKANVTVSGNIHSIYCSSYTDSSVTSAEQHSCRLAATTASILAFWDQVKESVLGACSQEEAVLFDSVLKMLDRHKSVIDGDDSWKTLIHHVVPNWEVGYMVFGLDYKGRIASDSYSDGRDAGASRKKPHYDTRRRDYGRYGNYHGKDSYSNSNYRSSSGSSSSGKDYSHGKTQNASGGKYSSTSTSTSTSSQASSSNSTSSSKSTERASSKSSESLTVFIKPILGRTKEQEIVSFFDKCKIDRVYLQTYYNSDDASYAHVRFQDAESVKEALKMNGKEFKGQKLTVEMPHSHDSKRSDGHQKYTKPTTSK